MAEVAIIFAVGYLLGGAGARFRGIVFTFVLGTIFGAVSIEQLSADIQSFKDDVIDNVTDRVVDDVTDNVNDSVNNEVTDSVTLFTSSEYETIAREKARDFEIDETLFVALITQESKWNPQAESSKGARGLGQVMPFNAKKCGITEDDLWLPRCNLGCSALILKEALDYWKGDVKHALAEYNAGRDAVENRNALTEFRETRIYVARILAIVASYQNTDCHSKGCLRMKEKAQAGGESENGLFALATLVQSNVKGLIWFSGFNDGYKHIENGHKEGRALDFTLVDETTSKAVVKQVKTIGKQAGVTLRILDEYISPSANATAGHIHVEFNNIEDAKTFLIYAEQEGGYKHV